MKMRDTRQEFPTFPRIGSSVHISFIRSIIRRKISIIRAVVVTQRSRPLTAPVHGTFFQIISRFSIQAVIQVTYHFPVDQIFRMHNRCSRNQMHGGTHHIKIIAYTYHIRIRHICPNYRIRKSPIPIIPCLCTSQVWVQASHGYKQAS